MFGNLVPFVGNGVCLGCDSHLIVLQIELHYLKKDVLIELDLSLLYVGPGHLLGRLGHPVLPFTQAPVKQRDLQPYLDALLVIRILICPGNIPGLLAETDLCIQIGPDPLL